MKAEEFAEKAYSKYCEIFTDEHPKTFTSLINLIFAYKGTKKIEKAVELAENHIHSTKDF